MKIGSSTTSSTSNEVLADASGKDFLAPQIVENLRPFVRTRGKSSEGRK
jgi:hypothetical protein